MSAQNNPHKTVGKCRRCDKPLNLYVRIQAESPFCKTCTDALPKADRDLKQTPEVILKEADTEPGH